jgi:DNA uptake protein ComE-like DNA-binding protein
MRQESNHRMSNGERDSVKISNSRAMGVIVLIALLFLFQVVTFVVQKVRMRQVAERVHSEEAVAGQDAGGEPVAGPGTGGPERIASGSGNSTPVGKQAFPFNPNTITQDSLQLLGFSQRQAASIIKYRTKGGKFRVKRDFAKMYVVDSAKYALLEPHILLPDSLPGRKSEKSVHETGISSTKLPLEGKPRHDTLQGSKYGTRLPKEKYVCNLNTADSAALVQLYGIGGYYARKILQYRERLGGSFVDTRQLLEIEGFTQERFEKIKGNVVVLEEDVKGFSLLKASREELERHPYIGPYAARGIETFLRLKGRENFSSDVQLLEALVKERVISAQNADKLKEYLLHL